MSDLFVLAGSWKTEPSAGTPSSDPVLAAPLLESVALTKKHYTTLQLTSDAEVAVSFGALASASVITVRVTGGKAKLKVTSADGTAQLIPVDPLCILISKSVPYTALAITRETGLELTAKVFLGQYAS